MEPRRFQLRGATLAELRERIRLDHGEDALIVSAEKVTVGGIKGFFARQHYEVTVEVPPRRRAAHALDLPARLGIAALLDDADEEESQLRPRAAAVPPATPVSTESDGFAALMDELTFATARAEPPVRPPAGGFGGAGASRPTGRSGAPSSAPSSDPRPPMPPPLAVSMPTPARAARDPRAAADAAAIAAAHVSPRRSARSAAERRDDLADLLDDLDAADSFLSDSSVSDGAVSESASARNGAAHEHRDQDPAASTFVAGGAALSAPLEQSAGSGAMAALLAAADRAEAGPLAVAPASAPAASGSRLGLSVAGSANPSDGSGISDRTGPSDASARPGFAGSVAGVVAPVVPRVLTGRGDLVLLVGLTDRTLEVARAMIVRANGGELRVGGLLTASGVDRVDDRRSAGAARAAGVERQHPVFVAFGLGRSPVDVSTDFTQRAASLAALRADQIWVVADAAHKPADTERWVQVVASAVPVDGAVGLGRESTATPETLASLGLPVLWHAAVEPAPPTTRRAARGMAGNGSR